MFVFYILCIIFPLINASVNKYLVNSVKANQSTLRFVHAIWRHGHRTPSILIPSDIENNITTWKQGLGELTTKGMAQQYRLGQFLRLRYDGFIGSEYSPFEVYYRSSDYNRTLESAQCNAAGFFSSNKDQFLKGLNWRPVPVHTLQKYLDHVLNEIIYCPTATKEEERLFNSDIIKSIENENKEFLQFLADKSGFKPSPLPLRDIWKIYDPLNSEFYSDEHEIPKWINETVQKRIKKLFEISSFSLVGSELLVRLRSGVFFSDILNRMQMVAEKQLDSRQKFYFYSAHDSNIIAILSSFDIHIQLFPSYASLVLIELHESMKNEFFVKLFYKYETDSKNLLELNIPNCGSPCLLNKLAVLRKNIIPLNWEQECGLFIWYLNSSIYYFVGLIIIFFAIFVQFFLLFKRVKLNIVDHYRNKNATRDDVFSGKFLLTADDNY